jgi:hypothetical protein
MPVLLVLFRFTCIAMLEDIEVSFSVSVACNLVNVFDWSVVSWYYRVDVSSSGTLLTTRVVSGLECYIEVQSSDTVPRKFSFGLGFKSSL